MAGTIMVCEGRCNMEYILATVIMTLLCLYASVLGASAALKITPFEFLKYFFSNDNKKED